MLSKKIEICKIYVDNEEDFSCLNKIFGGNNGVIISNLNPDFKTNIPVLVIGWKRIKKEYPDQKIKNRNIKNNIFWTFSLEESKESFKKEAKEFVKKSLDEFFNLSFISYDSIINGDFKNFIESNINKKNKCFVYFYNNACYIYNDDKIIVVGLDSIDYVSENSKKIITDFINEYDCIVFNYENISQFVNLNRLKKLLTIENIYWTKFGNVLEYKDIQKYFFNRNVHRYVAFVMSFLYNIDLNDEEIKSCYRQSERDIITSWLSSRAIFFSKNFAPDKNIKIKWDNYKKYTKSKYSNKRSVTGRIYCVSGFNTQMIPKKSDIRKQIVSRYDGGKIVVFDYVSFESKISLYYSKNKQFINKYKDKDLHLETAKAIFGLDNLSEQQRKIGKDVNHAILYGGGDTTVLKILKTVPNKNLALQNAKNFLEPILDVVEYINNIYKEIGYLKSDFGVIIKPTKDYAAFNNFIQFMASEIVVDKLFEIKEFLKGKKIQFLFQVHDSFVFDFHPTELFLIEKTNDILCNYKELTFPVEVNSGNNYFECK